MGEWLGGRGGQVLGEEIKTWGESIAKTQGSQFIESLEKPYQTQIDTFWSPFEQ